MEKRFIPITAQAIGEEPDYPGIKTSWWLDKARPLPEPKEPPGYVAVQTEGDKDPNNFVACKDMRILYTDPAEYYFVCGSCYSLHEDQQWSGSTEAEAGWEERAVKELKGHERINAWCQFCDPIFGNGGWALD